MLILAKHYERFQTEISITQQNNKINNKYIASVTVANRRSIETDKMFARTTGEKTQLYLENIYCVTIWVYEG